MKLMMLFASLCAFTGLCGVEDSEMAPLRDKVLALERCDAVSAEEIAANEARIEVLKKECSLLFSMARMLKVLSGDEGWKRVLCELQCKHEISLMANGFLLEINDRVIAVIKNLLHQIAHGRLDISSLSSDSLCDAYLEGLAAKYGDAVDRSDAVVRCVLAPLTDASRAGVFTSIDKLVVSYIFHWLLRSNKVGNCAAALFSVKYDLIKGSGA